MESLHSGVHDPGRLVVAVEAPGQVSCAWWRRAHRAARHFVVVVVAQLREEEHRRSGSVDSGGGCQEVDMSVVVVEEVGKAAIPFLFPAEERAGDTLVHAADDMDLIRRSDDHPAPASIRKCSPLVSWNPSTISTLHFLEIRATIFVNYPFHLIL